MLHTYVCVCSRGKVNGYYGAYKMADGEKCRKEIEQVRKAFNTFNTFLFVRSREEVTKMRIRIARAPGENGK